MIDSVKAIVENNGKYYFFDDPVWDDELRRDECVYILNLNDEVGYHMCNKSILYDNMDDYVDELQNETQLPSGNLLVAYYWWDGHDLCQHVDVNVTREEIIENVKNQKYREGADYFLMPS